MSLTNCGSRIASRQSRMLMRRCIPLAITPSRGGRFDKKGNVKPGRNRPKWDWRKIDHNPAKIPSAWIPDSWYKENTIDYEREKELVKYIPGYKPKILEHEDPNYHTTPIHKFTSDTRLVEGLKQAACLTKSVLMEELPHQIREISKRVSIPDQDQRVTQVFQHALLFDIDPKTLDKDNKRLRVLADEKDIYSGVHRYCPTILQNLSRLCQSLAGSHPKLLSRMRTDSVETFATFHRGYDDRQTSHFETDWKVTIAGSGNTQMLTSDPLLPFATMDDVKKTETMQLPDIYPVLPVVDLKKVNIYEEKTETGILSGFSHSHLHTLMIPNTLTFSAEETYGQMVSQLFACLYSRAVYMYGDVPRDLPTPISGQCISSDGQNFQFLCMQLNTTKLGDDSGIKNMVWVEDRKSKDSELPSKRLERKAYSSLPMYSMCSHRAWQSPDFYLDYDPTVFQTYLSLWLNGAT